LLREDGSLAQTGFARALLPVYDRRDIKAAGFRIKEWDYYLITCGDFGVALTIDDNSYMGMTSASFLDFGSRSEKTVSKIVPFTNGRVGLPASSGKGDTCFRRGNFDFAFRHESGGRRLTAHMDDFDAGAPFEANIRLAEEPRDSMVIATPFGGDKKAFYFNQKIIGMRASGWVEYDGVRRELPEDAFGLLDWGRGVWTYDNVWYWGAGQGLVDGHVFGFNIGYGFGDTSAASENMLFYDGTAHKLDRLTFNIPRTQDGRDDYMRPWTFTSSDGRFEMDFVPILDRSARTSALVILSDQHQVFGRFTGRAVLDDGKAVEIKDFLGFAEKVHNKW